MAVAVAEIHEDIPVRDCDRRRLESELAHSFVPPLPARNDSHALMWIKPFRTYTLDERYGKKAVSSAACVSPLTGSLQFGGAA
jgi:hypothetical protein